MSLNFKAFSCIVVLFITINLYLDRWALITREKKRFQAHFCSLSTCDLNILVKHIFFQKCSFAPLKTIWNLLRIPEFVTILFVCFKIQSIHWQRFRKIAKFPYIIISSVSYPMLIMTHPSRNFFVLSLFCLLCMFVWLRVQGFESSVNKVFQKEKLVNSKTVLN